MGLTMALRHLLDATRHATAAAVLRASTRAWPEWARASADGMVTELGRQAAVSAIVGTAHLVAALAMACGCPSVGDDLDGDACSSDDGAS